MGLAPLGHVLFKNFLNFNPKNPKWAGRDRFVLSNGHACVLLYSLLHLFGYDVTLDDLKNFRQLGSRTPGHPENDLCGVEVTTGPLGQGIANAVGLALAESQLAATFNKPGYDLIDNYTYAIFGDGCMQEGVASEAMSLAGHLKLGKLIAFYDDNHITIDGDTNVSFTEDVLKRLEAYGWHTIWVKDGNTDLAGITAAIEEAKKVTDKPSVIKVTTTIGYGSKQQGTHSVHGAALKKDDIVQLKEQFGFDPEQNFVIPKEVTELYAQTVKAGAEREVEWNNLLSKYSKEFPELASELTRRLKGELPAGWEKKLPTYSTSDPAIASRKLSETVLTDIFEVLPELIGGSADLTGSNLTRPKDINDYQPTQDPASGDYTGRYIRYGVREHGMGAVMNGIAAYGAFIPYGGTFLNFVSYAAGAVRLSALSHHHVIWVATHDSIGLGEDGPTHQPIETLAHFRAIPNLQVWRPADGNETSAAYFKAITNSHSPSIICLSRQNLPQLEGSSVEKASKGGYTLVEAENPDVLIVSTGSEVYIAVDAVKELAKEGIKAGVISLPDWHTFNQQPQEYRLSVFPDGVPILSAEVMSTSGWQAYSHQQFGINRFGASGPYQDVYKYFEFTPEGIAKRAKATAEYYKGQTVKSPLHKAF
ncbi:transketolase TKL1 [Sugiyamaella lignohabitans]|uniref:transketolase n=1 Tax=Sugiyamaella lignohabitans TaxID=796027 RepID=A0A167FJV4_9ASCO|nr:transketolase TKL1 [Sugiyamaella lignohabitans]ANB15393.1 transketolase TKL1 [Sugiyamaella lignohabitans]